MTLQEQVLIFIKLHGKEPHLVDRLPTGSMAVGDWKAYAVELSERERCSYSLFRLDTGDLLLARSCEVDVCHAFADPLGYFLRPQGDLLGCSQLAWTMGRSPNRLIWFFLNYVWGEQS